MLVAGVDACKTGWLIAMAAASDRLSIIDRPFVVRDFKAVLEATRNCKRAGVDIPIGLSENEYWRAADVEAREILGRRAPSVFPAPVRPTLAATLLPDFREFYVRARELSFQACGRKMTVYAHGILKKVREVNEAMTPELQALVVEVHPEVSFHAMSHGAITYSKNKPEGQQERHEALASWFEAFTVDTPKGAGLDDFLDACAAAWTASRVVRGEASRLPPDPPLDARGLRIEIAY